MILKLKFPLPRSIISIWAFSKVFQQIKSTIRASDMTVQPGQNAGIVENMFAWELPDFFAYIIRKLFFIPPNIRTYPF